MIADRPPDDIKALPWYFLHKLMMANVTARDLCLENPSCEQMIAACNLSEKQGSVSGINPLDLITALFLSSDGFLQQAMALKMSMCQFSVPLLLPNCDPSKCTLMLWALRAIVKEYRPHSMNENEFIETSIVLADIPMVSFVRLGENSLSKSNILNQVFSNPQQQTKQCVHREMEWGNMPRRISSGLVEVSWYLPKGNKKIDVFEEPLAVANLRGDIRDFETQFTFLCQTSTAVFVFCENVDAIKDWTIPKSSKSQMYVVCSDGGTISDAVLRKQESRLGLQPKSILMKCKNMNDAMFVRRLQNIVRTAIKSLMFKMSITTMVNIAKQLKIPVDENNSFYKVVFGKTCQNWKKKSAD
ncbi:up-regulator of cell proliferation-like [Polymixia lowei]